MATTATFTLTETLILSAGWLIMLPLLVYVVLAWKKTPANQFLKAWWNSTAIVFAHNRTGEGFFEAATRVEQGFLDTPTLGHILMTESSQVYDRDSKLPVYTSFTEFASTIPSEYPAIRQQLQERGFRITDFSDYERIIKVANKEHPDKENTSLSDKRQKQLLADMLGEDVDDKETVVKDLLENGIEIPEDKTYKLHELADMFPYNIHPSMLEAKIENEVSRRIDDEGTDWQTIGGWATVILAICIGGAVAYEMTQGQPSNLTCEVVRTGVENATTTAGNLTV